MATGIVSALKRRLPTSGGREVADAIQTDTPINPGQFRRTAPRFSWTADRVTTAILSPSGVNAGVGFAIPSTWSTASCLN